MSQFIDPLKTLRVRYHSKVCTITFARPDVRNRFDNQVLQELRNVMASLTEDSETHVVVITGMGADFCHGTFDPAIRGSMDKETIIQWVLDANMLLDELENLPQITIGAINGLARGSGVELSLTLDMRYAAASAGFLSHEAGMGGFPGGGAPVRLPMAVGYSRAIEILCSARTVSAKEAKEYGLVLEVFPDDALVTEVTHRAEHLAQQGPLALRGAKRVAKMRQSHGNADARMLSNKLRRDLEWSADVAEAIKASREGRSPVFVGR